MLTQSYARFWKFYDEDPLCYEDDLPAYWNDILKHSIWNPFPAIPVPESWLVSLSLVLHCRVINVSLVQRFRKVSFFGH